MSSANLDPAHVSSLLKNPPSPNCCNPNRQQQQNQPSDQQQQQQQGRMRPSYSHQYLRLRAQYQAQLEKLPVRFRLREFPQRSFEEYFQQKLHQIKHSQHQQLHQLQHSQHQQLQQQQPQHQQQQHVSLDDGGNGHCVNASVLSEQNEQSDSLSFIEAQLGLPTEEFQQAEPEIPILDSGDGSEISGSAQHGNGIGNGNGSGDDNSLLTGGSGNPQGDLAPSNYYSDEDSFAGAMQQHRLLHGNQDAAYATSTAMFGSSDSSVILSKATIPQQMPSNLLEQQFLEGPQEDLALFGQLPGQFDLQTEQSMLCSPQQQQQQQLSSQTSQEASQQSLDYSLCFPSNNQLVPLSPLSPSLSGFAETCDSSAGQESLFLGNESLAPNRENFVYGNALPDYSEVAHFQEPSSESRSGRVFSEPNIAAYAQQNDYGSQEGIQVNYDRLPYTPRQQHLNINGNCILYPFSSFVGATSSASLESLALMRSPTSSLASPVRPVHIVEHDSSFTSSITSSEAVPKLSRVHQIKQEEEPFNGLEHGQRRRYKRRRREEQGHELEQHRELEVNPELEQDHGELEGGTEGAILSHRVGHVPAFSKVPGDSILYYNLRVFRGVSSGGSSTKPPLCDLKPQHHWEPVELELINADVQSLVGPAWSAAEHQENRRIIRIERKQVGAKITAEFSILGASIDNPTTRMPGDGIGCAEVSCIEWWVKPSEDMDDAVEALRLTANLDGVNFDRPQRTFFITSVEVIKIVELLIGTHGEMNNQRRERGRVRSNLVPFWSKQPISSRVAEGDFDANSFRHKLANRIMTYDARKPRGFDKEVRIMRIEKLEAALKRALQSYYTEVPDA